MARRGVIDCDGCKCKAVASPGEFVVTTDRFTDAAGSSDTWEELVDLCPACMAGELRRFLRGLSHADAATWFLRVTGREPRRPREER